MRGRIAFTALLTVLPLVVFFIWMNVPNLFSAGVCGTACMWKMPLLGWVILGPLAAFIGWKSYDPELWDVMRSDIRGHIRNGLKWSLGAAILVAWGALALWLVSTSTSSDYPTYIFGMCIGAALSFFIVGWIAYDWPFILHFLDSDYGEMPPVYPSNDADE